MTDPWVDVRKKYLVGTFQQIAKEQEADLKRVLSDADALLVVVQEHRETTASEWKCLNEIGRAEKALDEWVEEHYPFLAALPGHLK